MEAGISFDRWAEDGVKSAQRIFPSWDSGLVFGVFDRHVVVG